MIKNLKFQISNFKSGFTLTKASRRTERAFTLMKQASVREEGFTLIELLVVMSIIGILVGLSVFGLQGARQSSRDAKRKTDLESIRSGIEIYKADCDHYPSTLSTSLYGSPPPTSCSASNTYISAVPSDPISPTQKYAYSNPTTTTYVLCATLEQAPSPAMNVTGCGSCTTTCNYKVTNP